MKGNAHMNYGSQIMKCCYRMDAKYVTSQIKLLTAQTFHKKVSLVQILLRTYTSANYNELCK